MTRSRPLPDLFDMTEETVTSQKRESQSPENLSFWKKLFFEPGAVNTWGCSINRLRD